MATGGIVQAALCADHPFQHRSHVSLFDHQRASYSEKARENAEKDGAEQFRHQNSPVGSGGQFRRGIGRPIDFLLVLSALWCGAKIFGLHVFFSYFFAALSFLAAPVLARYMGVVKTMAFSHGLASLIYLFLPLAPSFSIAAAMTVARSFLAYMDNPLRSSFIMGIVRPEDRGSAAGITTLSRHVPVAVSPTLSAYLMQAFSLSVPIFIGGFLQLFHDCVFYVLFRNVKPPEEQATQA